MKRLTKILTVIAGVSALLLGCGSDSKSDKSQTGSTNFICSQSSGSTSICDIEREVYNRINDERADYNVDKIPEINDLVGYAYNRVRSNSTNSLNYTITGTINTTVSVNSGDSTTTKADAVFQRIRDSYRSTLTQSSHYSMGLSIYEKSSYSYEVYVVFSSSSSNQGSYNNNNNNNNSWNSSNFTCSQSDSNMCEIERLIFEKMNNIRNSYSSSSNLTNKEALNRDAYALSQNRQKTQLSNINNRLSTARNRASDGSDINQINYHIAMYTSIDNPNYNNGNNSYNSSVNSSEIANKFNNRLDETNYNYRTNIQNSNNTYAGVGVYAFYSNNTSCNTVAGTYYSGSTSTNYRYICYIANIELAR